MNFVQNSWKSLYFYCLRLEFETAICHWSIQTIRWPPMWYVCIVRCKFFLIDPRLNGSYQWWITQCEHSFQIFDDVISRYRGKDSWERKTQVCQVFQKLLEPLQDTLKICSEIWCACPGEDETRPYTVNVELQRLWLMICTLLLSANFVRQVLIIREIKPSTRCKYFFSSATRRRIGRNGVLSTLEYIILPAAPLASITIIFF